MPDLHFVLTVVNVYQGDRYDSMYTDLHFDD